MYIDRALMGGTVAQEQVASLGIAPQDFGQMVADARRAANAAEEESSAQLGLPATPDREPRTSERTPVIEQLIATLKSRVSTVYFEMMVRPSKYRLDDGVVVITTSSSLFADRMRDLLAAHAEQVAELGIEVRVEP
jgi:hypothetical protein